VLGLQPLVEGGEALFADEHVIGFLEVLEPVHALARVGHQDLRLLLEDAGDHDRRNAFLDGRKGLDHVAAHVKVDLAYGQQHPAVGLGTPLDDLHIEAVLPVGAVRHRLVEAAMLRLCQPIGSEADLDEVLCEGSAGGETRDHPAGD
jgi:hypothetical protein